MAIKVTVKLAKPKVNKSRKVKGKNLKEVLAALQKFDEWGLYDGATNHKNSAKKDSNGKITSVTLNISPVITMPDWSGYGKASKAEKASWDKMYSALLKHENNHHDIQAKCMAELKKQLEKETDMDLGDLQSKLETWQTECQKKQDAYDKKSGHGEKEGVVLDTNP